MSKLSAVDQSRALKIVAAEVKFKGNEQSIY